MNLPYYTGVRLAALLEVVSGKPLWGLVKNATMRIQWINNLYISFIFMANQKINIENIQAGTMPCLCLLFFIFTKASRNLTVPEDIADRDLKLTLALLWNIILHYQLKGEAPTEPNAHRSTQSPQNRLLQRLIAFLGGESGRQSHHCRSLTLHPSHSPC